MLRSQSCTGALPVAPSKPATRSFAEVRARRDRLVLGFLLSRVVEHPRIIRTLRLSAHRTAHFVDIARPADVDRSVRDWLSEAYACSPV